MLRPSRRIYGSIFAIALLLALAASGASAQDVTWFGGTTWNATTMRWEAVEDGLWTFESGVGSELVQPGDPGTKQVGLHRLMEGWGGVNVNSSENARFRRLTTADFSGEPQTCVGSPAGLGGTASLWAGLTESEADSLCWPEGQGYGDLWNVSRAKTFIYPGSGNVTLSYDYVNETEASFDYTFVEIDPDDTGPAAPVILAWYDGAVSGSDSFVLTQAGGTLPAGAGTFSIRFRVTSDGAYSDEDGFFASSCGAFAVDDITLTGAVTDLATFETGDDGWELVEEAAPGGDWSDIRDLADLPGPPGSCGISDSVLVFIDHTTNAISSEAKNLAVSPWIDLEAAGVTGLTGRFIEFDVYQDFVRPERVGYEIFMQHAFVCPESGVEVVSLLRDPFGCLFGPDPCSYYDGCTPPGFRLRIPFTASSVSIPASAERVRIAIGVSNVCAAWGDCPGGNNDTTPYFDNIRFGVYDPATTAVPESPGTSPVLRMLSANPLTGSGPLRVELAAPAGESVALEVFNIRGERVRTLFRGVGGETLRLGWDRRNQQGRQVPGGVYFLSLSGGGARSVSRLLILP